MCRPTRSMLAQQGPLKRVQPVSIPGVKLHIDMGCANQRLSFSPPPASGFVPTRTQQRLNRKKAPPRSILRKGRYSHRQEVPGRLSVGDDDESCSTTSSSSGILSRSSSEEPLREAKRLRRHRKISFSKRVTVQEFFRAPGEKEHTFYKANDFVRFQYDVLKAIRQYERTHPLDAPTGGVIRRVFHAHPALAMDTVDDEETPEELMRQYIRKVLLVDSHDLILQVYAQAFQRAMPHATIVTATATKEALGLCEEHHYRFDVILVDARLSLFHSIRNGADSGSLFLRTIHQLQRMMPYKSLLIGTSAHLDSDRASLEACGADFCWAKPLQALDAAAIGQVLHAVQVKRGLMAA